MQCQNVREKGLKSIAFLIENFWLRLFIFFLRYRTRGKVIAYALLSSCVPA